jgi:hypothetical protein
MNDVQVGAFSRLGKGELGQLRMALPSTAKATSFKPN